MPTLQKGDRPPTPPCPTDLLLALLSGPWTMPIVWSLFEVGPARFGALKRRITGISSRLLTERLRMLEAQGFVHRHEEKTVPPQVTYAATERLQRLCGALEAMSHVADEWHAAQGARATSRAIMTGRNARRGGED